MEIIFHKQFKKSFNRLPLKIQEQFYNRLELFEKETNNMILNNHSVDKAFRNCRSINVSGDYRAIFIEESNLMIFVKIGTHSELY